VKVLLIGGTGFTGAYVAPRLLDAGMEVTCLVRPGSDRSQLPCDRVRLAVGSMDDQGSLTAAMRGHQLLICIASIGFGHAPNLVTAARAAGIDRALFVSTTAIFTQLNAKSKAIRIAGERAISESDVPYTILRPTMIYGSARDRNMARLIRYLLRWPIVLVAGSGDRLQQPIYVDDVAQAVVDAVSTDRTIGHAYNIAGAAPLTFNNVIDTIAALLGRRIHKLHMPVAPIVATLRTVERLRLPLPLKAEQVLRLNEDKAFPWDEAARDFGFSPRTFAEGISREIHEITAGR
jgi:nucleoside-diphosphate-sugar epimerase